MAHTWPREHDEHYVEPAWCSERLFQEEPFVGPVYDPAGGFGTIIGAALRAGHEAVCSDIATRVLSEHEHCFVGEFDFLASRQFASNTVTDPPFDLVPQFVAHALRQTMAK